MVSCSSCVPSMWKNITSTKLPISGNSESCLTTFCSSDPHSDHHPKLGISQGFSNYVRWVRGEGRVPLQQNKPAIIPCNITRFCLEKKFHYDNSFLETFMLIYCVHHLSSILLPLPLVRSSSCATWAVTNVHSSMPCQWSSCFLFLLHLFFSLLKFLQWFPLKLSKITSIFS